MAPGERTPRVRARRQPELGTLHRVLREHLATFLLSHDGLPRFVRAELERYLTCGQLALRALRERTREFRVGRRERGRPHLGQQDSRKLIA